MTITVDPPISDTTPPDVPRDRRPDVLRVGHGTFTHRATRGLKLATIPAGALIAAAALAHAAQQPTVPPPTTITQVGSVTGTPGPAEPYDPTKGW